MRTYNRQLEGLGKKPVWHFYDNLVCSSSDTEVGYNRDRKGANEFM